MSQFNSPEETIKNVSELTEAIAHECENNKSQIDNLELKRLSGGANLAPEDLSSYKKLKMIGRDAFNLIISKEKIELTQQDVKDAVKSAINGLKS